MSGLDALIHRPPVVVYVVHPAIAVGFALGRFIQGDDGVFRQVVQQGGGVVEGEAQPAADAFGGRAIVEGFPLLFRENFDPVAPDRLGR
jgi:hypothetical protein